MYMLLITMTNSLPENLVLQVFLQDQNKKVYNKNSLFM